MSDTFDFSRQPSPFTEAQEARIREIVAEIVWTRPGHLRVQHVWDPREPFDGGDRTAADEVVDVFKALR